MTDLFTSYASDFAELAEAIEGKLGGLPATGEARRAALRRADMEAEEAEEILGQMDVELQGLPGAAKARCATELRERKMRLEKIRKDIRSATSRSTGRELPGGGFADSGGDLEAEGEEGAYAQRQRLLQGTATLEDGSRRLEESHRLALQTEDMGADILRDLRGQREQIENSRDTLRQADTNIDRSSRTLQLMIRRAKQQKLTMAAILTVLVLLILLILYSKF
ncbi:V-snare-domain-containing protein [Tilletiopsis washingtonensis]|uniref:V-snare-domain-containing protein n=1 Tax=Tilletiopsis washingtonensis TaxID=58919 RepID=A0A316Z6X0_9BASI|nr:V-snare-domain-containing protein [Tilletiopsis washingtonensis]PWN97311.1 V-snare-domain-containing protein [Tilletiopsis washingtonensis]